MSRRAAAAPGYPDELIDRLEVFWGEGFLSPGGAEEVREVLRGIEVRAKSVLDIGCGTAGPAISIARNLGASEVVAIDVEPGVVARGRANVSKAGLDDRVEVRLVAPGPLPFPEARFDIVFSKDALLHIEDKPALYADILRVLRPGGRFAASDWLAAENAEALPEFNRWRALSPHDFAMQTPAEAEVILRRAGFAKVSLRNRNDWYIGAARSGLEHMRGPLRQRFVALSDEAAYEQMLAILEANAEAANSGGLRPTHLRGERPGG